MALPIPGYSHLILMGQNLVTWPYVAAREAGKCTLLAEQHYTQLKLELCYKGR